MNPINIKWRLIRNRRKNFLKANRWWKKSRRAEIAKRHSQKEREKIENNRNKEDVRLIVAWFFKFVILSKFIALTLIKHTQIVNHRSRRWQCCCLIWWLLNVRLITYVHTSIALCALCEMFHVNCGIIREWVCMTYLQQLQHRLFDENECNQCCKAFLYE